MWSSDRRTGNLQKELTKTHTQKTTFCPTRTQTHTQLQLTPHISERTHTLNTLNIQMPTHTSLHLAHSHTSTHSFFTLIRGGELIEAGGQDLTPPPPRPLST